MSNSDCSIFETTVRETNAWLSIVMDELKVHDPNVALQALLAGLHALRNRVGTDDAARLAAMLPMLLRGAYYEGWLPGPPTDKALHAQDFLKQVTIRMAGLPHVPAEAIARATYRALAQRINANEAETSLVPTWQ